MPPKKAAAAASKPKAVNGTKATTTKSTAKATATKAKPTKAPAKTAAKPVAKTTKTTTKAAPKAAPASRKRKPADDEDDEEPQTNGVATKRQKREPTAPSKKVTTSKRAASTEPADEPEESAPSAEPATKAPAAKKPKTVKPKVVINQAPTQLLDLYTFGGGDAGELGFAGAKGTKEIRRPRLNPYLTAEKAGVVQFSVGGMHTACLTHDNKILTWGVNDQGALGRDTTWDGGLKDIDADASDDDSDSDEGDTNPHESTPGEVDFSALEQTPVFTQVTCLDSATFALTDDGLVYGWGTFRSNEGIFGFSQKSFIQQRPVQIENLKNIVFLASGANHILALDNKGAVYSWGAGQQNQLGRRILERHQSSSLLPVKFGLRGKMATIGAGAYHSFAVNEKGVVYSWGLNSFGQTGAPIDSDGSGGVHLAQKINSLAPEEHGKVIHVTGGAMHTIAVTETGAALSFGRLDGFQSGIKLDTLPDDHVVRDANNNPRILTVPTPIPGLDAATAGAGSDHSIVVTKDGKAYGFGFNAYGQVGIGSTDDVPVATWIDNTAVRGKQIVFADCGGQFSVIATKHQETNGVNGDA